MNDKKMKAYTVYTRKNCGSTAVWIRERAVMELDTFKKYEYAVEWIQTKGDTNNVYFITCGKHKEKWCYDERRKWHLAGSGSFASAHAKPMIGSNRDYIPI